MQDVDGSVLPTLVAWGLSSVQLPLTHRAPQGGRGLSARKAEVEPGTLAGHPQPLGAVRPTDTWAGAPELSDSAGPGWSHGTIFFLISRLYCLEERF